MPASVQPVTRHSVWTWMRTLLTLESTRATVNLGIGSLALTRTSSPSSTSTRVLGGQPGLEGLADVLGDVVLTTAVLDRHFYVFDSPPTGVTAKRMVPSEFALSLTSIRQ